MNVNHLCTIHESVLSWYLRKHSYPPLIKGRKREIPHKWRFERGSHIPRTTSGTVWARREQCRRCRKSLTKRGKSYSSSILDTYVDSLEGVLQENRSTWDQRCDTSWNTIRISFGYELSSPKATFFRLISTQVKLDEIG